MAETVSPTTSPASFIDPDPALQSDPDPAATLGITIFSGRQAVREVTPYRGLNRIFDDIIEGVQKVDVPYEDQCSIRYYYDLVETLRNASGEYDRVVEVGCFMGGSAAIIAGCIERFDFDFDIVDTSREYLLFTFERIRRSFPHAAGRIRLFHGTLPQYVQHTLERRVGGRMLVHHDGAHDFTQVTKDLASLSFLGYRCHSLVIQDTNLRGTMAHCNFVDMAVYAIFGTDVVHAPIGAVYTEAQPDLLEPNIYQGNYFVAGMPEGIVVPIVANTFHYPHPSMRLEAFL